MEASLKNKKYCVISSERNSYQLDLGYKTIELTFCQLLALRKKIIYYTSFDKLEMLINGDNYVLLLVADKSHLLYLDIPQLLDLKDLIESIFI